MERARDFSRTAAYLLTGYIFGFVTARSDADPIMSFKRMLITIAWAAGIALLVWFERSSQHRQTKQWEKVRSRGKWPFVINRYLLARAGVLLLLLFLPVMIQLGATTPLLVALAFSVLILCPLFLYIGYHEWMKNEREFLADPLIKASRARIEQGKLP